jgi:hypothetical protein
MLGPPVPLANRLALEAVRRLRASLTPSQFLGQKCGRPPDGGGQPAQLSVVALAAGDIAILSATAQALGHPGLDADVAGLLDLAPTEQTLLLIARLTGRRPRRNRP